MGTEEDCYGPEKIIHDNLESVLLTSPSDYKGYGNGSVERDTPGKIFLPDCSMGCAWFVPLSGDLGADWGVCANQESHRSGLLTFEHQGCTKFTPKRSDDLDDDDPDLEDKIREAFQCWVNGEYANALRILASAV